MVDTSQPSSSAQPGPWWGRLAVLLFIGAAGFILLNAWLCDDAYITLRVVDNFLNGHGLTFNPPERVQVSTHPLWLLALISVIGLTGETPVTVMLFSSLLSIAALAIVTFRMVRDPVRRVVVLLAFLASKAFVDYSTSGLENPLSHVLLALLLPLVLLPRPTQRTLVGACVLGGLLLMNRLDYAVLVGPPLLVLLWRVHVAQPGRFLRLLLSCAAAFLPLVAWHLFSLSYFGFLFPNTAYAKLASGISSSVLMSQGVHYLLTSLRFDPITLLTCAAAVLVAVRSRQPARIALAIGILLYGVYVIRIGGCFMGHRFLTAIFFTSLVLLATSDSIPARNVRWAIPLALALGAFTYYPTLRGIVQEDYRYPLQTARKVHDEHAMFHPYTGLTRNWTHPGTAEFVLIRDGKEFGKQLEGGGRAFHVEDNIGFVGFYAGPGLHIIDPAALSDPFLARLPQSGKWFIGHFYRTLPEGYEETVRTGTMRMTDPRLIRLYENLQEIVTGDIWSQRRWSLIWQMNRDHLLKRKDAGVQAG